MNSCLPEKEGIISFIREMQLGAEERRKGEVKGGVLFLRWGKGMHGRQKKRPLPQKARRPGYPGRLAFFKSGK